MGTGSIVQLNVSPGGVPKLPVPEATVGELGLVGDGHDDNVHHGGPQRAVSLYSAELLEALAAEGHPIAPGTTGENVTVRGLDWDLLVPGVQLRLGESVLIEVTGYATPCKTIARSFAGGGFNRIHQQKFPGWSRVYAKVLASGRIRPGDTVELLVATTTGAATSA